MPEIANALSIDVEDYFQVSALAPHIARSDWERMPCRVERNVDVILGLLADSGGRATFFTLGWIAERYPALVTRIAAAGHEVASHGYAHHRATHQSRAEFYEDIRNAKLILEDILGTEVRGYRAPSFSIVRGREWARAQAGSKKSESPTVEPLVSGIEIVVRSGRVVDVLVQKTIQAALTHGIGRVVQPVHEVECERQGDQESRRSGGEHRGRGRDERRGDGDRERSPGESAFGDHVPAFMLRPAKVA